jgi:hypothetical protein
MQFLLNQVAVFLGDAADYLQKCKARQSHNRAGVQKIVLILIGCPKEGGHGKSMRA